MPVTNDTPGYPNSEHAAPEELVNSIGRYTLPAAPLPWPRARCRSDVVQAGGPDGELTDGLGAADDGAVARGVVVAVTVLVTVPD
jgi:hypothetical protein